MLRRADRNSICGHWLPAQGFFRPEMLNRLDEIVVFRQLMRPQVSIASSLC